MSDEVTARRAELLGLLGDLPPLDRPIRAERTARETCPHYILEKWTLDLNGFEPVPAYLTLPLEGNGPFPAILYNHAHAHEYHVGKDELLNGRDLLQQPPYAEALAAEGIAALCMDHWAFGGRATRTETALIKQMLWEGRVLWGMMVYDSLRALDFLISRPEIDGARIGTLGLSLGSTMAWWVAALDARIKACVVGRPATPRCASRTTPASCTTASPTASTPGRRSTSPGWPRTSATRRACTPLAGPAPPTPSAPRTTCSWRTAWPRGSCGTAGPAAYR